jgi:hypothetical protein
LAFTPDITGFFDAQRRLREATGVDAAFRLRTAYVWPSGTQLNPETGSPFDPTVKPVSGGDIQEVVVRCSYVTNLVRSGDPSEEPGGAFREADIVLGLPAERRADVEGAAEVEVADVLYRIAEIMPDPTFNDVQRYLVFGEAR